MRAGDPMSEVGLADYGHKAEDAFWQQTLRNVAERFGVEGDLETQVVCVDRKRQWRRAGTSVTARRSAPGCTRPGRRFE